MTNIQMLLSLAAMILLSLVIINVSKNSLYTEDVMYDSNFGITATSIGASIIEDASKKRFDNYYYVDSSTINNPIFFTSANDLGIDSGEVLNDSKTFNDFDDYDKYEGIDSSMPTASFNFSSSVCYVDENNPDVRVDHPTFHKKITVKVWSKSMKDTLILSSIYSYWNFLP